VSTVRLDGLPTQLFAAFDEATEGLLREFLMDTLAGDEAFTDDDVAKCRQAKQVIAAAIGHSTGRVDLELAITADLAASFPLLQAVLDHANRLAREQRLLCLPVLPEIAALRNWICEEVVGQTNGAPARRWHLPETLEMPGIAPASWPGMSSLPDQEAWIVGDDTNRIIGASTAALDLLGWDQLVGERLLVVIPHEFREQHIASFTRGVLRGTHQLLDQPLALTALGRNGDVMPINLTLSRHAATGERIVFLAKLERR
jgi:PAS domain-containing protein